MNQRALQLLVRNNRAEFAADEGSSRAPAQASMTREDAQQDFSVPVAASGLITLEETVDDTDSPAMKKFKKMPKVDGANVSVGGGAPHQQPTPAEKQGLDWIEKKVRPNLGKDMPPVGNMPHPHLSDPPVIVPDEYQARRSGAWYSILGASMPDVLRAIAPVFPSETDHTGRSWGVGAQCAPVAEGDSTSTRFEKLRIKTCSVVRYGEPAQPAAIVQQYADLDAARQWFNFAYALATDEALINALDAVNPKSGRWDDDRGAEPVGFLAQVRYVRAISEAIANGYNALNIPWLNDPIARGLWRDYFAGQDGNSDTSVVTDYNAGQFFRKDRDADRLNSNLARALLKARSSNAGAIPAALVDIVARVTPQQDRHPIRFYFSAGVMLTAITSDDGSPYYASRATNRGFATSSLSDNRRTGFWSSRHEVLALADVSNSNVTEDRFSVRLANVERFDEYQNDWYANRSSTDRIRRDWGMASAPEYTDWRTFSYDTWTAEQREEEISATAPMRWYMNFLREWAKSLTTTTPMVSDALLIDAPIPTQRSPQTRAGVPRRDVTRILVDSLSWASDLNMRWVRALGDQAFNAALSATVQDQVNASVPEPNRTVTLIGEAVGGTASTIGNALLPGVGSLIGSGVSAITTLVARLIPEPQRLRFGRDDLGRPKPSFERLSLDGSIRDGQLPTFSLLPPGYCRRLGANATEPLGSVLCGASAGGTTDTHLPDTHLPDQEDPNRHTTTTDESSLSATKVLLALGIVVVLVLAIRAFTANKQQRSSNQTTARGSR